MNTKTQYNTQRKLDYYAIRILSLHELIKNVITKRLSCIRFYFSLELSLLCN